MSAKKARPLPESLHLPPTGADSHAHLDDPKFDVGEVLARALACGVRTVGNVFLGPQAYHAAHSLFQDHKHVFFLLGVHPHEAAKMTPADAQAMREAFLTDPRLRAVGEIGLDYHYDFSPRTVQKDVFLRQLELARELNLPVALHCREAEDDCLNILDDLGFAGRPLLWHCFGLGPDWVGRICERGWHLSVPGTVTYPKNEALRAAIPHIPGDRLLLETDAPYLAPEPYRGKTNEPAFLGFTAATVAALRGEEIADLWTRCGDNARRFFGLT